MSLYVQIPAWCELPPFVRHSLVIDSNCFILSPKNWNGKKWERIQAAEIFLWIVFYYRLGFKIYLLAWFGFSFVFHVYAALWWPKLNGYWIYSWFGRIAYGKVAAICRFSPLPRISICTCFGDSLRLTTQQTPSLHVHFPLFFSLFFPFEGEKRCTGKTKYSIHTAFVARLAK